MAEQSERKKFRKTEEEFIDDGLSERKQANFPPVNEKEYKPDYKKRSLENLRREAREKGVVGYTKMNREELANRLRAIQKYVN